MITKLITKFRVIIHNPIQRTFLQYDRCSKLIFGICKKLFWKKLSIDEITKRKRSIKKYIIIINQAIKILLFFGMAWLWNKIHKSSFLECLPYFKFLCSVIVLIFGGSLIILSYNIFRKNFIRFYFLVFVIIIGICIYGKYDSSEPTKESFSRRIIIEAVNDVNNVLSSFFPSRGDTNLDELNKKTFDQYQQHKIEYKDGLNNIVILYVFYHSLVFLTVSILSMSLWGRRLASYFHNLMTLDKNKYVFWGKELDERYQILGDDIYQKNYESEIIISLFDDCIGNYINEYRLYDKFFNKNFILRIYDGDSLIFENLFAEHHFFISNDEAWNIAGTQKLLEERVKLGIKNTIHIYIKIGEGEKSLIYQYILNQISMSSETVILHVFNESELIARDFINKHPTLQALSDRGRINYDTAKLKTGTKFKILLLGFGWQGKRLLSNIVENSQFLTEKQDVFDSPLSVDIYDKQIVAYDQYEALRSDACHNYHLKFLTCDVMSSYFLHKMEQNLSDYDRIIISLGDDSLNLEIYALLYKLKILYCPERKQDIFVKLKFLIPINNTLKSLMPLNKYKLEENTFGIMSSVYSYDTILCENKDEIAKQLHRQYTEAKNKKENNDPWLNADLYQKQSSRAQAEGINNLLYLLGYRINTIKDNKIIEENKQNTDDNMKNLIKCIEKNDLLEALSENEHLRWEAFMCMRGIRRWVIDDTNENEVKNNDFQINQVIDHFRHGNLVDYKDIPKIDDQLNAWQGKIDPQKYKPHQTQDYDRNFVKSIPNILQNTNKQILKNEK